MKRFGKQRHIPEIKMKMLKKKNVIGDWMMRFECCVFFF